MRCKKCKLELLGYVTCQGCGTYNGEEGMMPYFECKNCGEVLFSIHMSPIPGICDRCEGQQDDREIERHRDERSG